MMRTPTALLQQMSQAFQQGRTSQIYRYGDSDQKQVTGCGTRRLS
jgi:hypothetical protein